MPRPRRWTPIEEEELRSRLASGASNQEVGDLLGRTKEAVRLRAVLLGLRPSLRWD